MKIIPSDRIEMISPFTKADVERILRENTQPKSNMALKRANQANQRAFEGIVSSDNFEIQRVITGKNSFLPQITGTLRESANGTRVLLHLGIHGLVIGFMVIWLGFVGLVLLAITYGIITQGTNPLFAIGPLVMCVFGIGLVYFGYNSEKEKALAAIKQLIDAKIRNDKFANSVYQ